MSPHDRLINGYALLPKNDVFGTKPFSCHIFISQILLRTYFGDISEKSENKHLF